MKDKQSTSRIIDEMNETMRGLHRCGAITSGDLEKFIKHVKQKTQCAKSLEETKNNKSQTSKSLL